MRNGGGAIMAIGRASGSQRVERAILDALDSPLLHGNDINHAKRILFNIYASDQTPILITEMQEISEFFDQLDPDIDVIWGTSADNTLGEDAKVIILATDMDDDMSNEQDEEALEDDHYERLMARLYKPLVKTAVGAGDKGDLQSTVSARPVNELTFTVEPAPEPEPAIITEPKLEPHSKPEPQPKSEPQPTTTLGRWKSWLNKKLGEMISEED